MAHGNEVGMDRRLGQIAGLFAFALVVGRLGRLLMSGPEIPQWHFILGASAVLGGVVWWLLSQLFTRRLASTIVFLGAGLVLFLRISVPITLTAGILPSADTPTALVAQMEAAIRLIRSGVPPIIPTEGVIAILAILVWTVGALYVWGATSGPIAVMMLPSIVLYLQFAVFDRAPAGLGWMLASALMIALAVAALAMERRGDAGRARDVEGRPLPRQSTAMALIMAGVVGIGAMAIANGAAGAVSEYGNVPWRSGGSGYGVGGGGITYDRFVKLKQRLLSPSNAVVFRASLAEGSPPSQQIYWRMETLDEFVGTGWGRSDKSLRNYEPGRAIGPSDHRYQGTTAEVLQNIRIDELRGELMPTAGVATQINQADETIATINPRAVRVASDSSLIYRNQLRRGDQYQILATYPLVRSDLGALATDEDGQLSPLFAAAADAGVFSGIPSPRRPDVAEPRDLAFYRELPDNLPSALKGIALAHTDKAVTDFEKAWMLQHWFRDSGDFTYSLDVTTGDDSLALEDWLSDRTSLNYRKGYCQQFATSMAVLGRVLEIPSRVVWGFTPGSVATDGTIVVRDNNAHSWVEMWMDGFGWVRFDPTPRSDSLPASITASFDPATFINNDGPGALAPPGVPIPEFATPGGIIDVPPIELTPEGPRWWILILPAVVLLAGVIPLIKTVRRRRRLKTIRNGDITAAWDEIVDQLTDLGETVPGHMTPLEFATETDPALLSLAVNYSASIYGGRTGGAKESDLLEVEAWIYRRYDTASRTKAAISLRSLMRGD